MNDGVFLNYRLGFLVDKPIKALIERAAQLERRKLTDFCMTALTDATRRAIVEHEALVLSERDRAVFFDVRGNPPAPNERLQRTFAEHKRRVLLPKGSLSVEAMRGGREEPALI
jgi:uncharacterized protein (DUF1778 family)